MNQGLTLLEHAASCEDDMHVRGQDLKEGMALLKYLKEELTAQYGKDPLNNPHYGKIINHRHFLV